MHYPMLTKQFYASSALFIVFIPHKKAKNLLFICIIQKNVVILSAKSKMGLRVGLTPTCPDLSGNNKNTSGSPHTPSIEISNLSLFTPIHRGFIGIY